MDKTQYEIGRVNETLNRQKSSARFWHLGTMGIDGAGSVDLAKLRLHVREPLFKHGQTSANRTKPGAE